MGALLQCLFHICCNNEDEDNERSLQHEFSSPLPATSSRITRGVRVAPGLDVGVHQVAPLVSSVEHDGDEEQQQHHHHHHHHHHHVSNHPVCYTRGTGPYNCDTGIRDFFRKLGERWRTHDVLASDERTDEHDDGDSTDLNLRYGRLRGSSISSPLRTASSFDSSKEIPTINADEVVLPGSDLQMEIAKAASLKLGSHDDECVICMEGFDPTNPRMPTLCGCGENKTYFHLPCLYQWIEQSDDCPSCRQKLTWEEF